MTREEEPLARADGVDLVNWRGVPVKAVAVAIRAATRRAMTDFMVAVCGWCWCLVELVTRGECPVSGTPQRRNQYQFRKYARRADRVK